MSDTLKVAGRIGAELGAAKAEVERLREALRPFAAFEAVRSKQGGCTPKSGTVWAVASISEEAEITAEHLQAAVSALSQQPEPTDTFTAVDMATAAAQGFRDGQAAVEQAAAQDEQSPEQMLSREQIENIARKVHGDCIRLPGATYQLAAEAAVMYTLERIARRQGAEPECGNCFEGKSNMDHVCRKCGGSGKAEQAQAQDERELPDYLNDAIDNLVHDNYERSQAGSRNRQADADLIRAALAARPAQTEQQPIGWITEDYLTDKSATTYSPEVADRWRAKGWPVSEIYAAPIAQTAPRCQCCGYLVTDSEHRGCLRAASPAQTEQQPVAFRVLRRNHDGIWTTDGRAWLDGVPGADLLGDIAERSDRWRLEYAYAAPIAQTAPQPEQSGLVEALEAIVRQYPNPDISHVDYRVHACRQAEQALDAYRAALPTKGSSKP